VRLDVHVSTGGASRTAPPHPSPPTPTPTAPVCSPSPLITSSLSLLGGGGPPNGPVPRTPLDLAVGANDRCAECLSARPRWASLLLGVLICTVCAGAHRGLGTHISTVKSLTLDKWQPDALARVWSIGNARAALRWEARMPEQARPAQNDAE